MGKKMVEDREFVRGAARWANLCYFISKSLDLVEEDVPHSSIIAVYDDQWGDADNVAWNSSALTVVQSPSEKLIVIGEDGEVLTYVGGNSTEESLNPEPQMIRNAATIDGKGYACGMLRQVYQRKGEDNWVNMSAPTPRQGEEVGFEAIAGYSRKEMYAAGWNGELWEFDGKQWHDRSGLTNVILTSICCTEEGVVYVAGQAGVVLKGRHDQWELIDWDDDTDLDIFDIHEFEGVLYLATGDDLFTIEDGNRWQSVDTGFDHLPTCVSLSSADGVLWSTGHNDVMSFDGAVWQLFD